MQDNRILIKEMDPTEWIAPGFFVPKGHPAIKEALRKGMTVVTHKDLRLVVDYTGLNKYVQRPIHPFPATKDIINQLPSNGKYFATLDAIQGYHQIELSEESSRKTTFLLPSGRYRFLRAPMGLSASSDEWCYRSDKVIEGLQGVQKIVDDILVSAPTIESLNRRIRTVLDRCKNENIAISLKKFQVASTVRFAGHVISSEGVSPDPDRLKAITDFKIPTCIKDVRAFLGLANQLASFCPDLAHLTASLRSLLKKGIVFHWPPDHQADFERIKSLLTSTSVVKFYDPNRETELLTDASKKRGLGFALIQKNKEGQKFLIQCGSRSLTPAEENWATIELEAKAIEYGITKSRHYLLGNPKFTVVTDHRPLVSIFQKQLDDMMNTRILRTRERLTNFSFEVKWQPGKVHHIADALSRAPVFSPNDEDDDGIDTQVRMVVGSDPNFASLLDAAENDISYQEQLAIIKRGDFSKIPTTHPINHIKGMWDRVSSMEGLIIIDGSRIFVPQSARKQLLDTGHKSHCGAEKMKMQFRQLYYWPGMGNEIENLVRSCEKCRYHLPSLPKEPLLPMMADKPMQRVSVDIFESGGNHYLCMLDRFSCFPFAATLTSMTTAAVTKQLMNWFMEFGFPHTIRSDNGQAFRQEFGIFCQEHGIIHETSSPHFPQSNGHAECGVKICKQLLQKYNHNWSLFRSSLLEWRNVPQTGGYSPAQCMFGRSQKTALPRLPIAFQPVNLEMAALDRHRKDTNMKEAFDSQAHILPELQVGDQVVVQDSTSKKWDKEGCIKEKIASGRSYIIEFPDDGKELRRNRRFIRKV